MGRFPCPICASSMRRRNSKCVMWTLSWRRVTTDRGLWRKKPLRVSPCTAAPKMHRACAAFSTNAKSPHESSRYEHRTCPPRCSSSIRLHRGGSAVSLHRSDAFWLLSGASVSRFCRRPLGQAYDHILEQARKIQTRPHGVFSEERRRVSPVLPPPLPPDRTREHPQPPRA